jgi:hypothetical protein
MRYMWLVAHLSDSITHLNGSKVSKNDRDRSERSFVRHYASILQELEELEERGREVHVDRSYLEQIPARYFELEKRHGRLGKIVDIDLSYSVRDAEIEQEKKAKAAVKYRERVASPTNNSIKPKTMNTNCCDLRVKLPSNVTSTDPNKKEETEGDVVVVKSIDLRQTVLELKRHFLRMVIQVYGDGMPQSHDRYKLFHHNQNSENGSVEADQDGEDIQGTGGVVNELDRLSCSFSISSSVRMPSSTVAQNSAQRALMEREMDMYNLRSMNSFALNLNNNTSSTTKKSATTGNSGKECKFMNRTLNQLRVQHNDLFEIVLM